MRFEVLNQVADSPRDARLILSRSERATCGASRQALHDAKRNHPAYAGRSPCLLLTAWSCRHQLEDLILQCVDGHDGD